MNEQPALKAILLLMIKDYERRNEAEPIELLLARSGLGYQEIAELLSKKPDAVRMFLKRNPIS